MFKSNINLIKLSNPIEIFGRISGQNGFFWIVPLRMFYE